MSDFTVRVLSLERIIVSKTAANRPKDRLVIPVLRNTLATARELPAGSSERRVAGGNAKPAKRARK